MSEYAEDQLVRIAKALEKIAEKPAANEEVFVVNGIHSFYAIEVEAILDSMTNDFELRRALRSLVRRAKEIASQ